jgi:hypothetical protein
VVSSLTKPTKDDAEIFLMLTESFRDERTEEAFRWLMSEFKAKDYKKFKTKYPRHSEGNRNMGRILGEFETAGVLVSQGLLNEDLYFDASAIGFIWPMVEKIVAGMRKEMGPALWENAAWLAERQKQWSKEVWKPGLSWKPDRPGASHKK